ncbi:MAG: DUF2878 domain-containing protein [Candidatus Sumerlaeota bacterium]
MTRALNFIAFQMSWWAVVISARHNLDAAGIAAVLILNAPFLWWSKSRRAFVAFLAAATLFGVMADSILLAAGVFRISAGWQVAAWLCPPWLAALWLNFAVTFDYAITWLRRRLLLAALLGSIGGPLSYWGGAKFGVLDFGSSAATTLTILAVSWAIAVPVLLWMRQRLDALIPPG